MRDKRACVGGFVSVFPGRCGTQRVEATPGCPAVRRTRSAPREVGPARRIEGLRPPPRWFASHGTGYTNLAELGTGQTPSNCSSSAVPVDPAPRSWTASTLRPGPPRSRAACCAAQTLPPPPRFYFLGIPGPAAHTSLPDVDHHPSRSNSSGTRPADEHPQPSSIVMMHAGSSWTDR